MIHTYRIELGTWVYGVVEGSANIPYAVIKAFSAEDALTILRVKLAYAGYKDYHYIRDIECIEN